MTERLPARSWAPAREAPVLLTVQLVALWQVGMRALDYLAQGTRPALDDAASGPVAGLVLLCAAAAVLTGIAGRWVSAVIAGHALIGSWYLGLGSLALGHLVTPATATAAGIALSVAGVALLVHRRARTWARLIIAVPTMLAGQLVLADALGEDYRTGTALLSAGALHLTLAAGTALLWQRRRLADLVAGEVEAVAGVR